VQHRIVFQQVTDYLVPLFYYFLTHCRHSVLHCFLFIYKRFAGLSPLPSQLKSLSQRERSSPQQTVGRSPTPYFLCSFGGQLFSPPLFTPSL